MRKEQEFIMRTETFSRTESGKSWKSKPDSVETKRIDGEYFENKTSRETQRFFRRLGGSEYAVYGYQRCGYIVYRLTSCNPGRTIRKVHTFDPIDPDKKDFWKAFEAQNTYLKGTNR